MQATQQKCGVLTSVKDTGFAAAAKASLGAQTTEGTPDKCQPHRGPVLTTLFQSLASKSFYSLSRREVMRKLWNLLWQDTGLPRCWPKDRYMVESSTWAKTSIAQVVV